MDGSGGEGGADGMAVIGWGVDGFGFAAPIFSSMCRHPLRPDFVVRLRLLELPILLERFGEFAHPPEGECTEGESIGVIGLVGEDRSEEGDDGCIITVLKSKAGLSDRSVVRAGRRLSVSTGTGERVGRRREVGHPADGFLDEIGASGVVAQPEAEVDGKRPGVSIGGIGLAGSLGPRQGRRGSSGASRRAASSWAFDRPRCSMAWMRSRVSAWTVSKESGARKPRSRSVACSARKKDRHDINWRFSGLRSGSSGNLGSGSSGPLFGMLGDKTCLGAGGSCRLVNVSP